MCWNTIAAACLGLAALSGGAQEALPTDADLKSAYCMGVLEQRIVKLSESDGLDPQLRAAMAVHKATAQNDLHRLRSYVLPRAPRLDSVGLVTARDRGTTDFLAAQRVVQSCMKTCLAEIQGRTPQERIAGLVSCSKPCEAAEPAIERTKTCDKITWLPF